MTDLLPIPGFEGRYSASVDGQIYSHKNKKYLAIRESKTGYAHIAVWCKTEKRNKTYLVHRMIASAFARRNLRQTEVVEHLNHDRMDNRPINLNITTQKENIRRGHVDGRQAIGSRVGSSVLNERDVSEIRQKYASGGHTQRQLAIQYGVSKTTIGYIVRNEYWRHVNSPVLLMEAL